MKEKPVIGVSGPDRGGVAAWLFTRFAVRRAGGRALRITPATGDEQHRGEGELRVLLELLVLGGGADIDPGLYGEDEIEPPIEEKDDRNSFIKTMIDWLMLPLVYILRKLFSARQYHLKDRERDKLEHELLGNPPLACSPH